MQFCRRLMVVIKQKPAYYVLNGFFTHCLLLTCVWFQCNIQPHKIRYMLCVHMESLCSLIVWISYTDVVCNSLSSILIKFRKERRTNSVRLNRQEYVWSSYKIAQKYVIMSLTKNKYFLIISCLLQFSCFYLFAFDYI